MKTNFDGLLERFEQANNDSVKNAIYDEMMEYANTYHPGYVCYDMEMYVSLYAYAKTNKQRKHALGHISDIIDDGFLYYDELIENFKKFTLITKFLNEEDEEDFDTICMKALNFFKKQCEGWSFEMMTDQYTSVPDAPIGAANDGLKEVAKIIVSMDMRNLESYYEALSILENWRFKAVRKAHSFFWLYKIFTIYSIFFINLFFIT